MAIKSTLRDLIWYPKDGLHSKTSREASDMSLSRIYFSTRNLISQHSRVNFTWDSLQTNLILKTKFPLSSIQTEKPWFAVWLWNRVGYRAGLCDHYDKRSFWYFQPLWLCLRFQLLHNYWYSSLILECQCAVLSLQKGGAHIKDQVPLSSETQSNMCVLLCTITHLYCLDFGNINLSKGMLITWNLESFPFCFILLS